MKSKIKRKSQMEILGLAIVVAIILVATIFVVRFVVLKSPTNYRKGFVNSELALNMMNRFLKTSAENCKQLSIKELFQDCAQESSISCDNGMDSCKFVNATAYTLFRNTLILWGYNYEFLAYREDNRPFISLGKPCLGEKSSMTQPVPIRGSTLYVKLDVCN